MEDLQLNKMKKIAIIGCGGFGREVQLLIENINESYNQWEFIGYFDDEYEVGTLINSYPIIGDLKALNSYPTPINIAVAIGNPQTKVKIINNLTNKKIVFPNLIHPNVIMGKYDVNIGKGCIICAGNIITVNIKIGDFVILNLSCTVGHDTLIADYCSFMPSVNISGEVIINESVYVGTGAKIINQLEVGKNTIIGAGAVVFKSLPSDCTAVGIPAKPIKFNNE